jgi:hypothetical protein
MGNLPYEVLYGNIQSTNWKNIIKTATVNSEKNIFFCDSAQAGSPLFETRNILQGLTNKITFGPVVSTDD